VNALVIGGAEKADASLHAGKLIAWFEAEVLRGPGAFAIFADDYRDYRRAMEMKLLRELELPIAKGSAMHEEAS
jgi:hypothetical protein